MNRAPGLLLLAALNACVHYGGAALFQRVDVDTDGRAVNLREYHHALVNVTAELAAVKWLDPIGNGIADRLREKCKFATVNYDELDQEPDLIIDLHIRTAEKFFGAWHVKVNMALRDRKTGRTLATSRYAYVNNNLKGDPRPTAADKIGQKVAQVMVASACHMPRIGQGQTAEGDVKQLEAEQKNTLGRTLFKEGKYTQAIEQFDEALSLISDPRFQLNHCMALEAQKNFPAATASCEKALQMRPPAHLKEKIDTRLQIIKERAAGR